MEYSFNSVVDIPQLHAKAIFVTDTTTLFKENGEISPIQLDDHTSYIPWGADNLLPYNVLKKIEADETLATCQSWNAEVCYGQGLKYDTCVCSDKVKQEVDDFFFENGMQSFFLGSCLDFKHFGFCVSLLILSKDGKRITNIIRKEACNCRFTPADGHGVSREVVFANWEAVMPDEIEHIALLNIVNPWRDLQSRMQNGDKRRKFAIVSRIPTARNTYYPIPYYAAIFKSRWYDIKQLITTAKKAKLQNSAPIKYQIEISSRYWEKLFISKGVTSIEDKRAAVNEAKQQMIDFLTRAENSGKVLFSEFYQTPDGKEQQEVRISPIATGKEGGDWETDIQEAINIMCFTLRVHSNLVGSVPGKAQSPVFLRQTVNRPRSSRTERAIGAIYHIVPSATAFLSSSDISPRSTRLPCMDAAAFRSLGRIPSDIMGPPTQLTKLWWGEEEQRSASARKARPLSAVCDDELHGCRS